MNALSPRRGPASSACLCLLSRQHIEDEIEARIELLDRMDGDPDFEPAGDDEPTLGWSRTYALGSSEDLEESDALVSTDRDCSLVLQVRRPKAPCRATPIPMTVSRGRKNTMHVLALAFGPVTGFAFGDLSSKMSGTWSADGTLADRLALLQEIASPRRVVFVEEGGAAPADIATLQEWASGIGADCRAMTFEQAAGAWSGKSAATAEEMIALARERDGIETRNGSEALAVAAFLAT